MKKFTALSRIFIFALVLCLSVTVFAAVAFDAAEANGNLTITLDGNTINKDNTTAAGITYDPATDIITLNGVNGGELKITCDESDTFTIKVEGENSLKRINATGKVTTVTFTGTGTLTVTTNSGVNSAIEVTGNIKITSGTIKATADKWVINASKTLEIVGGTVEATARVEQALLAKAGLTIKDATVKATSEGNYGIYANNCSLSIENSTITASAKNYAICMTGANSTLDIKNSNVTASTTADNTIYSVATLSIDGSTINATTNSKYAIRALNGSINITDSKIGSESDPVKAVTSNAIYADNGNIDITGSEIYATAGSSVLYAVAGNITIDNSYVSAITAAGNNVGLSAKGTLTIRGQEYDKHTGIGTYVYSKANANAIYGSKGVSIQGGTVYAESTGADTAIGADFNLNDGTENAITITGGNVTAIAVQRPIKGDAVYLKEGRTKITANIVENALENNNESSIFSRGATVTILPSAIVTITANEYADWDEFTLVDDGVSYATGFDPAAIENNTGDVLMTFGSVVSKDFALNYSEWIAATDIYSVDIIWDDQDFSFDYNAGIQGPWDDQKHEYGDDIVTPGWTDSEFTVTIKNHSSVDITVALAIETVQNEDGLVLKIADNGLTSKDLEKPTTEEPTVHAFNLVVEGTPTKAYDRIATVTLTISKATANA